MTSPVTTTLNSVSMISSTDGWAVGDDGVILHWDGSTWTQQSSPTIAELNELLMLSSTDGWIVSSWTQNMVAHYDMKYLHLFQSTLPRVQLEVFSQ